MYSGIFLDAVTAARLALEAVPPFQLTTRTACCVLVNSSNTCLPQLATRLHLFKFHFRARALLLNPYLDLLRSTSISHCFDLLDYDRYSYSLSPTPTSDCPLHAACGPTKFGRGDRDSTSVDGRQVRGFAG